MSLPALRGPVSLLAESSLSQLLTHFPPRITYAFAYGSAVFAQKGQRTGKMVDLVLVVDSPVSWHTANMAMNQHHYSALRYFGPSVISRIQEGMASGVYYNPFVKVGEHLIKYGVISTHTLEKDLNSWNRIYIAGRLHKPVLDLIPPATGSLRQALHYNRESALRAVLLQEGGLISKFDLFHGVTELSYLGDSRMSLAENPDKTKNIVMPMMKEFERVYTPLLQGLDPRVEVNGDGILVQNTKPKDRFQHLMALPIQIQISLCRQLFRDPRLCDIEEIMAEISYFPGLRGLVRNAVRDTVWGSSIRQTVQGLMTAGFGRSWQYAKEKLKKGRDGRKARREAEASGELLKEDSPEMTTFQRPNKPVEQEIAVKIQSPPAKESPGKVKRTSPSQNPVQIDLKPVHPGISEKDAPSQQQQEELQEVEKQKKKMSKKE